MGKTVSVRKRETKEIFDTIYDVIEYTEQSVTYQAGRGVAIMNFDEEFEVGEFDDQPVTEGE